MLAASARLLGGGWLATQLPLLASLAACAREEAASGAAFTTFSATEGRAFTAFAAQIIPTDDTPGATEAGAVYFADRALAGPLGGVKQPILDGLHDLDKRASADATSFADLTPAGQIAIMKAVEQTPFFGLARFVVLCGVFSDKMYDGNRDNIGWTLIGHEHKGSHSPPFGYYDAEAAKTNARGPA